MKTKNTNKYRRFLYKGGNSSLSYTRSSFKAMMSNNSKNELGNLQSESPFSQPNTSSTLSKAVSNSNTDRQRALPAPSNGLPPPYTDDPNGAPLSLISSDTEGYSTARNTTNFICAFLVSFLISPLITLLVIWCLPSKGNTRRDMIIGNGAGWVVNGAMVSLQGLQSLQDCSIRYYGAQNDISFCRNFYTGFVGGGFVVIAVGCTIIINMTRRPNSIEANTPLNV
jgi:hypothetical protein